jgi:hypothetical protein
MKIPFDPQAATATYARIRPAMADPVQHSCVAHMWEWVPGNTHHEMDAILRVMSGDESAEFQDEYRQQNGDAQHGMVALACTAIAEGAKIQLFDDLRNRTQTGLLLVDAPPVFVCNVDAATRYLCGNGQALHARQNHQPLSMEEYTLKSQLMALQGFSDTQQSLQCDPRDPQVIQHAKAAQTHMLEALRQEPYPQLHNEVCVNARTQHVAGIVVQYKPGLEEMPDSPQAWQQRLQEDPTLLNSLERAFNQHAQLNAHLKEQGATQEPTVVIYLPSSPQQMLHFPPTQVNQQVLKDARKEVDREKNRAAANIFR